MTLDSASKPVRKSSAYPDPGLGAEGPGGRAAEGNLFCPAICPSAPPPSLKSSAAQELAGAPENAMKHGSRQLAGLGVLLARVIRRYQRESSGKLPFPAVPEFEFAARERASDLFPRFKIRPESDPAEHNDHAFLCQDLELPPQILPASVEFFRQELVVRRRASRGGSNQAVVEPKPVVAVR